jgi:hypothetical protein
MKRIALLALLAAFCGSALAEPAVEMLIVPPYPAATPWKALPVKQTESQKTERWIPADQSEAAFRDLLEADTYLKPLDKDPIVAMTTEIFMARIHCRAASVNGPKEGVENGYPVAYAQVYCVGNRDSNEDIDYFLKVIIGKSVNYTVLREFHRPAAAGAKPGIREFSADKEDEAKAQLEAQGTADKFLVDQVQLCPPASGSGECPVKAAAAASPAAPAAGDPMDQPGPDDLSASFGFTPGKTTADEVEDKLGRPAVKNMNGPGGRFNYMFFPKPGLIVACVFRKDKVLIRTVAYAQN